MKAMMYEGPRQLKVIDAPDLPMGPGQVRIKTLYSGVSHGTEMNVYRGAAPFFRRKMDRATRLFVPAEETELWSYPIRSCDPGVWQMGYSAVGRVIEVGTKITKMKVGDIVYTSAPHQSHSVKDEADVVVLPAGLQPEHGVFFTNLMTAFNGILDTRIHLGDTLVVSGLGVLGQLALQMARLSGAHKVFGVDLFEKRTSAALANGADAVFSPASTKDIALEIRHLTNLKGPDAVIEVSGNVAALHQAIRIAAPDTTVTALGWYQGSCAQLDLSEEFHHNRVSVRCSQTGGVGPEISHLWNFERKTNTCLELLSRLKLDNLVTKFPYDQVAEVYRLIDGHPADLIQAVLTYE